MSTVAGVGVKTGGSQVKGDWGHDVYPGSGLLDGGNTLLPA